MKHLYKALVMITFLWVTTAGFSKGNSGILYSADTQTTEITVSGNKISVLNLPNSGKLQIFSVLGINIATIDVKAGSADYPISLPKGYYIVKVGDVVRKIAVK